MSRAAIVAALNTVTGVSGHDTQPPAPQPGQAWPVWKRTGYENVPTCGAVPETVDWEVWLLLPALQPAAADSWRDEVAAALSQAGPVTAAEPDTLDLAADWSQPVPAIRFEMMTTDGGPQPWP